MEYFECPNCDNQYADDILYSEDGGVEGCEECTKWCERCGDLMWWHGNCHTDLCDNCQEEEMFNV